MLDNSCFYFTPIGRNENRPIKGIDTLLQVLAGQKRCSRNEYRPIKGIDTSRVRCVKNILSGRRNEYRPIEGIDTIKRQPIIISFCL